ncbi:hypothetical protein HGRIS_001793 [Hohenbuehelia grisea]|uniref:TOG domain-containing protein n=1 Tax=Hohenbuehelia grisea TaxID=104357 RepID=A0ABR3JIW5_9AGAR
MPISQHTHLDALEESGVPKPQNRLLKGDRMEKLIRSINQRQKIAAAGDDWDQKLSGQTGMANLNISTRPMFRSGRVPTFPRSDFQVSRGQTEFLRVTSYTRHRRIDRRRRRQALPTLAPKASLTRLKAKEPDSKSMSKSEIQSWISSTSTAPTDDTPDDSWQRDRVLQDWSKAIEIAHARLMNSRTKHRVQFLQDELLSLAKHADLNLSQTLDVFKLLTHTYPRYADNASREAVEAVGMELVRRDELRGTPDGAVDETRMGVAEQILGWLGHEVGRVAKRGAGSAYASSDLFVLLSWSCGLYTVCLKTNPDFTSSQSWITLVTALATLLDILLESAVAKPSMKNGVLVRVRRALRSEPAKIPVLADTLLQQAKSSQTPLRFVPLIGVSVDVLIRLRNVPEEPASRMHPDQKDAILNLYSSTVLMSKTPVPTHVATAFNDFIKTFVTPEDVSTIILPTAEKALLRSPEISLSVLAHFFTAFPSQLSDADFERILLPTLNTSKSSNPSVRTDSIALFKALVTTPPSEPQIALSPASQTHATASLLSLPKSGKTTGPDHRAALYTMLAALAPSAHVSPTLVEVSVPLISKETHEGALSVLARAVEGHLGWLLAPGEGQVSATGVPQPTTAVIAKEMGNAKPTVRRAFCLLAGGALWDAGARAEGGAEAQAFAKAVLPALESSLKSVAANPVGAPGGPVEAYVALACLLGPVKRFGTFDAALSANATIQGLFASTTKPSFLVWDKVYQKVTEPEDEKWLLRALEVVVTNVPPKVAVELAKNELHRSQLGLVFIHVALSSTAPETRKAVLATLERCTAARPHITHGIVRDAFTSFLAKEASAAAAASVEDGMAWRHHGRLSALLLSSASFAEDVDEKTRQDAVVGLVITAHHHLVCEPSRQVWIDLCQKARLDPHELVNAQVDALFKHILAASTVPIKQDGFAEASFRALTTLAFVSPEAVVPRAIKQLNVDMDAAVLNSLTELDLGVWNTPEGTAFIDVLASKKSDNTQVTKGKDAKMAKWEADVRKSLATKKAVSTGTLSKQDQAAVSAQLEKELAIRQRVVTIKANLERGLHMVGSLVKAGVQEFREAIAEVAGLVVDAALGKGAILAGGLAFETYLDLSKCSSDRLDTMARWIAVATLRSLEVSAVPEEMEAEPIDGLIIRVLYRFRSLSEQAPFEAPTFTFAFPLIRQILLKGGINATEEDAILEQVKLALDIIKFHCGEFHDVVYPRQAAIECLLHIIKQQPKLAKEASSTLVDLGEAMHSTVRPTELNVLLQATLSQESYIRNACLQTLQPFDLTDLDWSPELLIACHDDDEQNARLARHLWEDNGLDIPETFLMRILPFLGHDNAYVRASVAGAIAEAVEAWPQGLAQVLDDLQAYYREKAKLLAPEFDEYGMLISQSIDRSDPWPARLSTARTFEGLAPLFGKDHVVTFIRFLIHDEALGDKSSDVRQAMLSAGVAAIDVHGSSTSAELISIFEDHLARPSAGTETSDHIKEAIVIFFGRVAKHLDPTDKRIPSIVTRLVEALKTPAEQVQMAVSDCLVPLVKVIKPDLQALVDQLFTDLFGAPKYATRRGAAYGLAGVIKGAGLGSMKEFSVISRLKAATEDKKQYEPRQGAMFAFETMSTSLGRVFEPYITYVLPLLLTAFGDASADVREAAQDAARIIMGNMSGYGVKLILPSLLSGLEEKQWRTKKGSIELLGMMAYCSPRQLSLSLPIVIPQLTDVLTDSHSQVKAAANKSLKQFGEVISNPEIQTLTPVLLKAMVDPAKTPVALSSLLKTSFMHYIDHSSLALVVPIIERGLRERGADTKKKAAQIVGNLASLTDAKDFVPYLNSLLPLVHVVLVDPVPEARATAAKALGTLVERLGEIHFPDLVPGLLRTLKTDTSGVDRQGAAQGLSEVLSGLGMERLEGLLPDIIANAQSPRATVREGFMSLLVFLPATFGTRFQPHLPKIISPILSGLSDTEEYVREAAMRAGRMVVTNYASKAIDLLLPELEHGMFDPGWRIRQASITLVGELLFKVSGISSKAVDDEEEEAEATVAESSRRALTEVLGSERRDRILSALYLVRQDGVMVVRQASIQIWKALVHNTPRTVREILPELMEQIVQLVSSDEFEQQEIASRTTGELCRKFGEKILAEIIPILRTKASSPDARTREGVCLTLCDIMESSTDAHREDHEDDIISMVRQSLVDDEANVRAAAAKAFDVLQEYLGAKAIDQTIPTLLDALRQPGQSSGTALQALREVMNVRASTVFPVLIPTLTAIPMTVFNANALASLVSVAGNALSRRLTTILNALVSVMETGGEEELMEAVNGAVEASLSSIEDAEGLNTLMMTLLDWAKHDSPKRRVSAWKLFAIFCQVSELDSSYYRVDWVRQLVSALEDPDVGVHTAAWSAFDVFTKSVPKDELEPLVVPLRRSIESTGSPGHFVPGFGLPKGVAPMVPIIIAGLTTGSNEQRENAAYAIGDLVERTEENAIKPFVVPFTGPLIRVATQATTYPPAVKTGILSALNAMLQRIPAFVKPFFPQLQRTFVKSAADPASVVVRTRAAEALGVLMRHQPRVDPVVTELIASVKAGDDGIASSLILALAHVVKNASANVGEKAREACVELVADAFTESHDEYYSQSIAHLFKSLSAYPELLLPIINSQLVGGTPPGVLCSRILLATLTPDDDDDERTPNVFQQLSVLRPVAQKVQESAGNERPSIARPAREARELIKELDDESLKGLF